MNFWIASKYFFSLNNGSVINLISIITIIGITFSIISMIFVLSVFNGFEQLVTNLHKEHIPNLKIESTKGVYFNTDSILDLNSNETVTDKLKKYDTIIFSEVLEQEIILEHQKSVNDSVETLKCFSKIKGVDKNYNHVTNFSNYLIVDSDKYNFFEFNNSNFIVVGLDVANKLNLYVADTYEEASQQKKSLNVWNLKTTKRKPELIKNKGFINTGIYSISQDFDNYIFCSIEEARNILNKPNFCSSIELKAKDISLKKLKKLIQKDLGDSFIVKDFKEQMPFLYKMVNTEKIAVYLIFLLIVIVTMITLVGSMTIFILQKKEDMFILACLGSSIKKIKNIFFLWGQIIIFSSIFLGVTLGLLICYIQDYFHVIKIYGNFIVDHYPVKINLVDIFYVIILVLLIGFITSFYVSRKNYFYRNLPFH